MESRQVRAVIFLLDKCKNHGKSHQSFSPVYVLECYKVVQECKSVVSINLCTYHMDEAFENLSNLFQNSSTHLSAQPSHQRIYCLSTLEHTP